MRPPTFPPQPVRVARSALAVLAAAVTLALVACSADDADEDGATDTAGAGVTAAPTTASTAADAEPEGDPEDATSGPVASDGPSTDDAADGGELVAASTSSTLALQPSPDADLPTAAPGETEGSTPTTTPGPLTTPRIDLLEVGRLQRPTGLAVRPRDGRVFVHEQAGRVIALDDLSTGVVLDITDRVDDSSNEQGLLGLAFHPDDDLAYVNYTDGGGDTVVAEFSVDTQTGVFDPASARTVLTVDQPAANHNGGGLAFGPDGLLYIGLGDGGSADDPLRSALDLSSRLGKLLRIDPRATGDAPFVVPDDNPFVGRDGADPTIWSYGLRNPWRFSFDPVTGDLWIADVGQDQWEEVNRAPATEGTAAGRGLSFGWSAFEGDTRFNEDQPADGHTPPVVVYPHDDGNCSVTGGVVARDAVVPDLDGWYLYGDYCSGTIWGYDTTAPADAPTIVELASLPLVVAIAPGSAGDVYAVSNDGLVALIVPA